ncbi:MAG TPA: DUF6600 domain-containing protein [Terriglobia bacterium]|nr:DUF6600 domain-containing protein [Terriglobia bacterium]
MKSHRMRPSLGILVTGLLFLPSWLVAQQGSQQGLSHVRVVRLSYLSGTVAVKRPKSTEWAKAIVNTPIQEGYSVSTSNHSFAEVEFENGSTARLGELSEIDFTQLAMDGEGNKLNRLALEQGYATFHFMPEHGDVYQVKAAGATFTPDGKSEFRTDIDYGRLRAEVFSGSVDVAAGSKTAKLGKDKVLDSNASTAEAFSITHGITKDSWDAWTEARDKQTVLALNDQAVGARGPRYGWSDLDAYGEWADIPGYGLGWAPYESFGWSPYSAGLWDWYPSFGWTWISGEPWGWLPYHYGLWNYDASFGWFWMPGDFGFWSPALVSWYMGPGWIGWAPYGAIVPAGYGCVNAVPAGAFQNGQPVNSSNVTRLHPAQGTPINRPPVQATALAMLSGTPLARDVLLPGRIAAGAQATTGMTTSAIAATHAPVLRSGAQVTSSTSGAFRTHSAAPPTVLMGGDAVTEHALLSVHHNAFARFLGGVSDQPLRAQMGSTLGGRLRVSSPEGELGAFHGVREFGGSRSSAGFGAPHVLAGERGFGGRGVSVMPHASTMGGSRAGGGGEARGGFSAPAAVSSPSVSSGVSSSASVGGGAHAGGGGGGSRH